MALNKFNYTDTHDTAYLPISVGLGSLAIDDSAPTSSQDYKHSLGFLSGNRHRVLHVFGAFMCQLLVVAGVIFANFHSELEVAVADETKDPSAHRMMRTNSTGKDLVLEEIFTMERILKFALGTLTVLLVALMFAAVFVVVQPVINHMFRSPQENSQEHKMKTSLFSNVLKESARTPVGAEMGEFKLTLLLKEKLTNDGERLVKQAMADLVKIDKDYIALDIPPPLNEKVGSQFLIMTIKATSDQVKQLETQAFTTDFETDFKEHVNKLSFEGYDDAIVELNVEPSTDSSRADISLLENGRWYRKGRFDRSEDWHSTIKEIQALLGPTVTNEISHYEDRHGVVLDDKTGPKTRHIYGVLKVHPSWRDADGVDDVHMKPMSQFAAYADIVNLIEQHKGKPIISIKVDEEDYNRKVVINNTVYGPKAVTNDTVFVVTFAESDAKVYPKWLDEQTCEKHDLGPISPQAAKEHIENLIRVPDMDNVFAVTIDENSFENPLTNETVFTVNIERFKDDCLLLVTDEREATNPLNPMSFCKCLKNGKKRAS